VVLLAEADDRPEALGDYFGEEGGVDLLLNFYLDAHLFLALATERGEPIERALDRLPEPPDGCGWANFLRNYDELNLGRLPAAEREQVFERFAPDAHPRIYGRGIRRRLAPLLSVVSAHWFGFL
jgi:maltose alpha-D-glucosyltransferase/alpha-amylase